MSFLKRDLALLGMFGVIVFSFTDCSLLTKVDWTAIPPPGAGGTGESGNRMGRAGLDAACATAKTKLQLQHSKTRAVISVDLNDQILDMPEHYGIPHQSRPIVSSVGLEVAKDWNTLWTSPGDSPSLVCSGVMPPSSLQWLTGTGNKKQTGVLQDATVAVFGLWDFSGDLSGTAVYNNACNGWTLGVFDSVTSAHVGSTIADHDNGSLDVHPRLFD